MKSVFRGALVGVLIAGAWLVGTAGPEISGQSPSYIIGWIAAPIIVSGLIGAAIGGVLAALARA